MPYNPGTGIYTLPAIYLAIPGTTIIAAQHNTPLEDLEVANNYPRPVVAGGTGNNDGTYILKQSAAPTPTAEGSIQWDTNDDIIVVGNGAGQSLFYPSIVGTWTPTLITDATQFTSVTYDATVTGRYIKIGTLVFVQGYMETDAITVGPATGSILIGGLPFTAAASPVPQGGFAIGAASAWNAQAPFNMVTKSNSTTCLLYYRSVITGGAANLNVTVAGCNVGANSNKLQFGGCYQV